MVALDVEARWGMEKKISSVEYFVLKIYLYWEYMDWSYKMGLNLIALFFSCLEVLGLL
jgi:hypothetical protein